MSGLINIGKSEHVKLVFDKSAQACLESSEVVATSTVCKRSFWFMERDGGFTSVGVVIALTLTLALLFTTAQVYWVNSTSGEVQFVADAGALAAENVVAEYYVVARIADATVLSLSLFGLAVYGVSIVVSCIPFMQSVGAKLFEFGTNVFKARDNIAKNATNMLNKLQKALPFVSALNAATVISANHFSAGCQSSYMGFALLVPFKGEDIKFSDTDVAQDQASDLESKNKETGEKTEEAAEAKKKMDQAKLDGYNADCGQNPDYCLYERAGTLAGLSAAKNPYYKSPDTWIFDFAYTRSKAYFKRRYEIEAPNNNSLEERIKSVIRKNYYEYAQSELNKGYAKTNADGVLDAYFPRLFKNTETMRGTSFYYDAFFVVDGDNKMHGVADCPDVSGGISGNASTAQLYDGSYESCTSCNLSVGNIAKVASATTNTSTGFEHYYHEIADAADRYKVASKEYKDKTDEAKKSANSAFDSFEKALEALKVQRIDPKPPGRNGCIAFAFDLSAPAAPASFSSSFVASDNDLPPRIAISAAALVPDKAAYGNTILSSFLDRAREKTTGITAGVLDVFDGILGVWGDLLLVYSNGVDALVNGVEVFIRGIPVVGQTPLASWAKGALTDALETFGLTPADLSAPKPAIVNSAHVINASDSSALKMINQAKETYASIPGSGSGSLTDGVIDGILVEIEADGNEFFESEFTLYTISFGAPFDFLQIPITLRLPNEVADKGKSLLSSGLDGLATLFKGGGNDDYWE